MLYIVATPIGNLEDITFRAVRTLKEADLILAEDTRTSGKLLAKYDITTPLDSYHSYSSVAKINRYLAELKNGKTVALISDAGTPGISDPSFQLIKLALQNQIEVVPIPGVSAAVTALSVSGAPIDKFLYVGFLPLKKGRNKTLIKLSELEWTIVLYESVHRISKTLNELLEIFGDRYICIGREMTKMFEEYFRGSLSEAIEHMKDKKLKGEWTLVISPKDFKL